MSRHPFPLFFTSEGHLDLTWFFTLLILLTAVAAILFGLSMTPAAWGFLGSAFSLALLAAIPISKARILRNATLPGSVAGALASASVRAPSGPDQDGADTDTPPA